MSKRTSPTPPGGIKITSGVHAMRRSGTRREVTERVNLKSLDDPGAAPLEGWALNVSRGGLRAILEEKVELGQRFEVSVGGEDAPYRPGRVVWVQEEPDGVIVGLEFTGLSGLHAATAPVPAPDPDSEVLSDPRPLDVGRDDDD